MNNAIMATVMIAMMFAIAASTPYVFGPAPAVIFKTTEGDSLTDSTITDVGGRRGRYTRSLVIILYPLIFPSFYSIPGSSA